MLARRSVPIVNAKLGERFLKGGGILAHRVSLEHHVLVQVEDARVVAALGDAAGADCNFDVRERNLVVFADKNGQAVVQLKTFRIKRRGLFARRKERAKRKRENERDKAPALFGNSTIHCFASKVNFLLL